MKLIDRELLDQVSKKAQESPRRRMNYNFHDSPDAKAQRLLNALEPGTELPIHRHTHTAETYLILRGKIRVLFYNDRKEITESVELCPTANCFGVHIPPGQWHTLEVLEPETVIFEIKDGPYLPLTAENILE